MQLLSYCVCDISTKRLHVGVLVLFLSSTTWSRHVALNSFLGAGHALAMAVHLFSFFIRHGIPNDSAPDLLLSRVFAHPADFGPSEASSRTTATTRIHVLACFHIILVHEQRAWRASRSNQSGILGASSFPNQPFLPLSTMRLELSSNHMTSILLLRLYFNRIVATKLSFRIIGGQQTTNAAGVMWDGGLGLAILKFWPGVVSSIGCDILSAGRKNTFRPPNATCYLTRFNFKAGSAVTVCKTSLYMSMDSPSLEKLNPPW